MTTSLFQPAMYEEISRYYKTPGTKRYNIGAKGGGGGVKVTGSCAGGSGRGLV
jgi:hypothetical protein